MNEITFTFKTKAKPAKIVAALCARFDYKDTVLDQENPKTRIPNPESKEEFAQRMVGEKIASWVTEQDLIAARSEAEASVKPVILS